MNCEFAKSTPLTAARRVTLAAEPERALETAIRQRLAAVEGIKWLHLQGRELRVGYDVTLLDYDLLTEELTRAGATVERRGWRRWRAVWYRFVDHNSRDNALANPTCCSRPPPRRGGPGR